MAATRKALARATMTLDQIDLYEVIVANDERATKLIFRRFENTGRVPRNSVSDRVAGTSQRPDAAFGDIRPLVGGALGRQALEPGISMPVGSAPGRSRT